MITPNKILNHIEEIFVSSAILFAGMVLFINVVTRYFGYSMKWAEEFTRYIIVWITFIGGSICVRQYAHVGIDAFISTLSNRSQEVVKFGVAIIGIIFSVVMTWLSFKMVQQAIQFNQKTAAMMIPMWIPYAGIPIGSLLMTIRYFQSAHKIFRNLKSGTTPAGEEQS